MSDLQEILAMLSNARGDVVAATEKVAKVQSELEQSAQQLMALGVRDRASLADTAAQACTSSVEQLGTAAQAVDDAIKSTAATAGDV